MGHRHSPSRREPGARSAERRRLLWTLGLTAVYMLAEAVGGYLTNSLALLADAGHMLSDVAALGLSAFALWIAQRPATDRRSYGYHRTEILAALFNGATLIAIAIFILIEAWGRLREPPEVLGGGMLAIAVGGLVVNLVGLRLLGAHRHTSLNVRGAWVHLVVDLLGSLQVIAAAVLIELFGWNLADPVASVVIALLVVYSARGVLLESLSILMESVPPHLDLDEIRQTLLRLPEVQAVHDLHAWTITSGRHCLSAHVVAREERQPGELLAEVQATLERQFGIRHATIQLEPPGYESLTANGCTTC